MRWVLILALVIMAGAQESASLLKKKRPKPAPGMCATGSTSFMDSQMYCPCLSSCMNDAPEESKEIIAEALQFCVWSSIRVPDFNVLNSWEAKELMLKHCPEKRCIRTQFAENPTYTVDSLTHGWTNAWADTVVKCFPHVFQTSHPPKCDEPCYGT